MKLLIFDLDGTLIDSELDIVICVNYALNELERPAFPDREVKKQIGRGSRYLFTQLLGKDATPAQIDALVKKFQELYLKHLTDHTVLFRDVIKVLEHFQDVPKVIVSNKSQPFADALADKLAFRQYFKGIYGAEAFPTQKPEPGPILEVCSQFDISADEAVLVGDSEIDIMAGKAAGVKTVAALYGYGDHAVMRKLRPNYEIAGASDLLKIFKAP